MLALILGLISAIVAIVLAVGVNSLFSFDLTSFTLFFIVPVGAIFIGAIACWGYYFGLLKSNLKITKVNKLIGVLLALLTFLGTQFGVYMTTYVDDDGIINNKMEGVHISECFIEESTGEPINFISFTKIMVESQTISFSNRGRNLFEVEGNPIVNWIFFGINVIGMIIGSLVVRTLVMGSKKYCDDCKKYMKQKNINKYSANDQETIQKLKAINTLSAEEIRAIVGLAKYDSGAHFDVNIDWCEECNAGFLQLKYMQPEKKGKFNHVAANSIEVKLSATVVRTIIG